MGPALPEAELSVEVFDVAAGSSTSCAVDSGGAMRCWGSNNLGSLGQEDTLNRGDEPGELATMPAVALGTASAVIGAGVGSHTCVLLADGVVKCWGANLSGQLGLGDALARGDAPGEMGANLPAVDLGAPATELSVGGSHACALLQTGGMKCWGNNSYGQLGLGDTTHRGDQPAEMGAALPLVDVGGEVLHVRTGNFHTCALLTTSEVKCWGSNAFGQLGHETMVSRGGAPGEMGASLAVTDLGEPVVSILVGAIHTCARVLSGSLKCWGGNNHGQLGLGDLENRGDDPGEMGSALPTTELGESFSAVAVGDSHNCVILASGRIKCWGRNDFGQLGLGDVENRGDDPGEMGLELPMVELD
jgi:hypothetical protein